MRIVVVVVGLALLSGCAAPKPAPPAQSVQVPTPGRPVFTLPRASDDWRDWPLAAGEWSYTQDARGSTAAFGRGGQPADFSLRCELANRQLHVARRQEMATATPDLTIRTTSSVRVLALRADPATPGYVSIALTARDPILDAMGFSRGRFVVQQAGGAPLVLPAWAEVERVTEDCRG